MNEVEVKLIFAFRLPDDVTMSQEDLDGLEAQALDYLHWVLNEYVRLRTGQVCYFGKSKIEERFREHENEAN